MDETTPQPPNPDDGNGSQGNGEQQPETPREDIPAEGSYLDRLGKELGRATEEDGSNGQTNLPPANPPEQSGQEEPKE